MEKLWEKMEAEISDLITRMTLEEKASQLLHESTAVEHLDIPAYNWWNEALHGIARAGRATVFPQVIALAATFDPDLVEQVASAISDEGRAKHRAASQRGGSSHYRGLTFWSPNINIFRDPRWGRGQETFGEDPCLTGDLALAFVKGMQGEDLFWLKTAACAKHYAVHSGPEGERHFFDSRISPEDLWGTYLPAFKKVVEGGVEAVMGAYNRVNGEACCGSSFLLGDILREMWDFQGHVVSDCWAVKDFHEEHGLTRNSVESAALALKAGCDLNCGDSYSFLPDAVRQGLVSEAELDRAVTRVFRTRYRLGILSSQLQGPYTEIDQSRIDSEAHRNLAREAARRSVVLLKNNDDLLPVDPSRGRIFVTGPGGLDQLVLVGNYFGINGRLVSIVEGIAGRAGEGLTVDYRAGCMLTGNAHEQRNFALTDAKYADLVIFVGGLSPLMEGEEGEAIGSSCHGDRERIELPDSQLSYLRVLRKSAKKLLVILTGGSALALEEVDALADALLFVWYPGEEGGNAVAEIIFGDSVPEGKLPISFPKKSEDLPPFENYSMKGRTYRFRETEPLYPFGYGLSYTTFFYSLVSISRFRIDEKSDLEICIDLENKGPRDGREVVQLYIDYPSGINHAPCFELKQYRSVFVSSGEKKRLTFRLSADSFQTVGSDGIFHRIPGVYGITVASSSPPKSTCNRDSLNRIRREVEVY